ncbi:MAG: GNAT family N-acetyltransferase [Frankiales bacterium]|nr:GNAT family N-acetyltransferase [Frankiales bacterium]
MEVRSLGWQTDLMVRRLAGSSVEDRGDHIVVRTPHNPDYWWGNFFLMPAPPRAGDAETWLAQFAAEFPGAAHVAIGLDGVDGDVGHEPDLRAAGLVPELSVVLTTTTLPQPVRVDPAAEVRALTTDEDWEQETALRLLVRDVDEVAGERFIRRRIAETRELIDSGRGLWVGGFVDGRLVSSLGLVTDGSGLGRYQTVETHPEFRRRGLAGLGIRHAAELAMASYGVNRLVIIADVDYFALDLYRRLGFADAERQAQWERPAPSG